MKTGNYSSEDRPISSARIINNGARLLFALIELYDRCENKNAYPDIKALIEDTTETTVEEAIKRSGL